MSVQERIIVNESEEEAKKNRGKILGLFPRRQASGASTPVGRASVDRKEEDDDELPPREADVGLASTDDPEEAEEREKMKKAAEEAKKAEERALHAIPATAGFDFSAISKELGKDIDMAKLDQPQREPDTPKLSPFPRVERTGSAPPVHVEPPSGPLTRSASYAPSADDEGDITFSSQTSKLSLNETSAWDRPSATSPAFSPSKQTSGYEFNAWSNPTSSRGLMRSAPPARPHPPEFLANPFAADVSSSEKGTWRKDEDLVTANPW